MTAREYLREQGGSDMIEAENSKTQHEEGVATRVDGRQEQEMKIYASSQDTAIQSLLHEFQGAELEPHIHDDRCELIYLRQGVASLKIDGREVNARSGALIIIGAGAEHYGTYSASDRSGKLERYVLGLTGLNLPGLRAGQLLPDGSSPVVRLDMTNILTSMFQLIEREYLAQDNGWETVCMGVLDALFALIARGAAPAESAPQQLTQAQALANDILAYLRVHYCENISLQSVADHFYISPYYLSHLMKKQLQIPLMQYVIHLRISEAQVLLRDTDYPVKQIAQMVGYQNFNYFLNVFKKATGVSPGECRARSRE